MPTTTQNGLTAQTVNPPIQHHNEPDSTAGDKVLASLKASLALRGHAVHELANGGYAVCRWDQSKHCPDIRALQAFARQIGALQ